jgi:hypothetical protein
MRTGYIRMFWAQYRVRVRMGWGLASWKKEVYSYTWNMSIYYTIRTRVNRNRAWSWANTNGTRMNRNKLEWARMKHLWTRMEHEWTRMEHEWIQIEHEWNTNEVGVSTNTTLTNTNGKRVCNHATTENVMKVASFIRSIRSKVFFGLNKNGGQYKHYRITVKADARPHVFRGVRLFSHEFRTI